MQFLGNPGTKRAKSLQCFGQFIKPTTNILEFGMIYAAKQRFNSWVNLKFLGNGK
jgi:hypothetical protein